MNPSRERFELGLFEARLGEVNGYVKSVVSKLYGDVFDKYRPNDMLQTHFDGEKLNVTVIPREQVYFDTTDAGPQLAECQAKAEDQNEVVMHVFRCLKRPLSPSQVLALWPAWAGKDPPLTSIRRAISTLTKAGHLEKTGDKRMGLFGRPELCWKITETAGQEVEQGTCITRKL